MALPNPGFRPVNDVRRQYDVHPLTREQFADPGLALDYLEDTAPGENLLLLDIGGCFAPSLDVLVGKFSGRILGVVEDTENGHQRYALLPVLPCPVYSVARSPLKECEDHLIGHTVGFSTEALLRAHGTILTNLNASVIGYGKIGRSIAHALRDRDVQVAVYDANPVKRVEAHAHGFRVTPHRTDVLRAADLVMCATGNLALRRVDFAALHNGAYVASVTSSEDELELASLDGRYRRTPLPQGTTRFEAADHHFHVLNDGNAVNFLHGAEVGSYIHKTRILYLFGGAEQITLNVAAKTWTGLRNYSGPDGTRITRSSSGTVTYQVANLQGTATTAIDASTLAVTRRSYDPYGNPRGTQPTSWVAPDENRGFLGQPVDPASGLDLLGARDYDPILGRFLSPDPIFEAGDPNQMGGYTYAGDNPASGSDPSGLMLLGGDGTSNGPATPPKKKSQPSGHSTSNDNGGGALGSGLSTTGSHLAKQAECACGTGEAGVGGSGGEAGEPGGGTRSGGGVEEEPPAAPEPEFLPPTGEPVEPPAIDDWEEASGPGFGAVQGGAEGSALQAPDAEPEAGKAAKSNVNKAAGEPDNTASGDASSQKTVNKNAAKPSAPTTSSEGANSDGSERAAQGVSQGGVERTLDNSLDKTTYLNDVASRYGINMRGSGQDINVVFDPELRAGELGVTRAIDGGNLIRVGPDGIVDDTTAANTIAHELSHARYFLRNGSFDGDVHGDGDSLGDGTPYGSGNALQDWIEGNR